MVGQFIAGAVAVFVGGGLAFATVTGVVQTVQGEPEAPSADVMDYGTTNQ